MIEATKLVKSINQKWIDEKWDWIEKVQSQGRVSFLVGRHIINDATLRKFESQLIQNKFRTSFGSNSHGVKTLIIQW